MVSYELLLNVAEQNPETPVLDVHGDTREIAKHEVGEFLERKYNPDKNVVVKIIFGLGQGILAAEIPKFVAAHHFVAATRVASSGYEAGAVVYAVLRKEE